MCLRNGVPRAQHLCQRCNLHALQMRGTLRLSALPCSVCGIGMSKTAKNTMQLVMWQRDMVGVAHDITDCYEVPLMMLLMMPQPPSSSTALAAGYIYTIHSLHACPPLKLSGLY